MATYASGNEVRRVLARSRDIFNPTTAGSVLTLPDKFTTSIIEVKKNDTAVASGNYTFKVPDKLELTASFVSGDRFEIDRGLHLIDSAITEIIKDASNYIDSKLGRDYSLPFSSTPPTVETLAERLSRAFLIRELSSLHHYTVNDEMLELAKDEITFVNDQLELIHNEEAELIDSAGAVVGRIKNPNRITTFVGIDDSTTEV